MLLNISTASVKEIAVARFLAEGGYERYLRKNRGQLMENVQSIREEIFLYFPKSTRVSNPSGGSFLWVELLESIDTEQIYQGVLAENILFSPGHLFSLTT